MLWQIQSVMVKCNACTLDNALDNSYAEHLLSGKNLPVDYNTYISQMQFILSGSSGQKAPKINITRALSRLKSVFVTLDKPLGSNPHVGRKSWNTFHSPMQPFAGHDSHGEFEYQLQCGSKQFPEYPIRSHAEAIYQLRKTLGVQSNKMHSFDVSSNEYRCFKFILGIDVEKVLEIGFSGHNTRSGDILNVRFTNLGNTPAYYAQDMHILLHSDQILEERFQCDCIRLDLFNN